MSRPGGGGGSDVWRSNVERPGRTVRSTVKDYSQRCGERRAVVLVILPSKVLSSFLTGSQRSSVATSPSRLDSPNDRRRRFTALGEFATFSTQVARLWSAAFETSTSRTAIAPAAAARRSSYAARRQVWEHHLRGRPLGLPTHGVPQRRQVPLGVAGGGASPVVGELMQPEATNVRTKRTSRECMRCEVGEVFRIRWMSSTLASSWLCRP